MKAFLTGATGFIGGHVARMLRERGDEVVALVRSPEKASALRDLGCVLVEGDLSATDAIRSDKGEVGEAYVLAGEQQTMSGLVDKVSELSGPLMGFPPNLRELIRVSDGVTFWASDEKARRDLGYSPRDLETGLRETLAP